MADPLIEQLERALEQRQAENYDLYQGFVNPGFVQLLHMAGYGRRFVRASGCELEDDTGQRYLDFLSGYGVMSLGHNHPRVRAALRWALEREPAGFTQVDCPLLEGLAAERLALQMPGDLEKVFFCSSGAEAVEASLKLARAATGRKRLLSVEGGYHGLTLGALGLTDNSDLQRPFKPLLTDVERIPFDDVAALGNALQNNDVAAFVVEPILGEGGAVVPREGYLQEAAELCQKHRTLLVVDEVQTGLGRTGRMLAVEHEGIIPDVVALAKALGGGLMPVGAMVARGPVFERAYGTVKHCHDHSAPLGGGPLAMTAVLATLQVIEDEGLLARAEERGSYLQERLQSLTGRHRSIREVRGRGLMMGVKFQDVTRGLLDRTLLRKLGAASSYLFVQSVCLRLMEDHGIVVQSAVSDPGMLKVMPPLTVSEEQLDRFVAALDAVLGFTGHASALAHLASETFKHGSWW